MTTIVTRAGKGSSLSWVEADANFTNLNNNKVETTAIADMATKTGIETFTNKTINLTSNTLTGTLAQFNTAVSDANLVSLAGIETLTNKSIPESTNRLEFIPSGTGAVSTTIQSKLRESVSVKDFGAVGDGVADDTAAINNWLAHIVANNKIGIVPAGTYRFTSQISGGVGSDWGIEGDGSAVVTLLYDGANTINDIITLGDGTADLINLKLSGFTLKSNTLMTAGIGLHFRRVCRSLVYDVIADGQDGNGKLWHGIRFNGLDRVFYDHFEVRAQKDGLQVNGLVGALPKADLHISNYKIASCDVGVRCGGAFGGFYFGTGSIAVCGDSFVLDNTLVAEANREIFFSPEIALDASTRSNIIIDQSIASQLYVNFPSGMWLASSGSHCIWIKNANGAKINIDAYIYNVTGDGVRIDDATSSITINAFFNTITSAGTYGINQTVSTVNTKLGTECLFINVTSPFNYTSNRATTNLPFPVSVQSGRAIYWENFTGTLSGTGSITFAHGKGGTYYKQVISVLASAKASSGAWCPLTPAYIDGSNISITGSAPFANQPYNVMCLVGDQAHSGW